MTRYNNNRQKTNTSKQGKFSRKSSAAPQKTEKKNSDSVKDIRSSLPDAAEIKNLLGTISDFRIVKLIPIGAFLTPIAPTGQNNGEAAGNFEILLPKNEYADKTLRRGDILQAFTYLDSEDRPVATLRTPAISLGGLALLKCNQATTLGAFLDWGLMKDLFLPFNEQTYKVKAGDEVLVTMYMDKSSRLCASMKVYKLLKTNSDYKPGDHVTGLVYQLSDRFGAYIAVDDIYSARIPAKDLVKSLRIGERPTLRVSKVLPDGKLELSMREPAHLQLSDDCELILNELKNAKNGFLPYHDKTESLILKTKFNMSKNAFKRAIGHLYKQGLIEIYENGIELK
ncbi:MAG: RNA-binding protein [Lachnospiraceae bacterium]|nr:RNA-binding protein [Lachnospiraceae bacterium]